jgi:hypothetical protein
MLLNRLRAVCNLKWRVMRNYARRKPVEAALRLLPIAFLGVYWLPMMFGLSHAKTGQGLAMITVLLWMTFTIVSIALLTSAGQLLHSVDLYQLMRFPLGSFDYFAIILLDSTINNLYFVAFVLLGPVVAVSILNPIAVLVVLPVLLLYAIFLVAWMHLLAGLRSFLAAQGYTGIIAQSIGIIAMAYAMGYLLLPGLSHGNPEAVVKPEYWYDRLLSIKHLFAAWQPFFANFPPGIAASSFGAALGGRPEAVLRPALILASEAAVLLVGMFALTRSVYRGNITLERPKSARQRERAGRSFAAEQPFGAGFLSRFAGLGFWQLVRKEWLYARRLGMMNVQIVFAPIGWYLVLLFHFSGAEAAVPGLTGWILIPAALLSCWVATDMFSQKFNWEGSAAAMLFLTPLPRHTMLAAKSFSVVMPLAVANAIGFAMAWAVTGAPAVSALGAATLFACGVALGDAHGSLISLIAPVNLRAFYDARRRKHVDQRGCLTEFLMHFATFAFLLALLPIFGLLATGLFMGSLLIELAGAAASVALTWYYTRLVRAEASRLLMRREASIWRLLKEPF